MKKTFIESIKIIAVALVIGWGVSGVSAEWTAPTRAVGTGVVTAPTSDNAKPVDAAINLGAFDQIKKGGIIINPQLPYPESKGLFVSPLSFFKKTFLPGADTSVYIGGASFSDPSFSLAQYPNDRSVPLTINLTGRTDDPTGAIKFKTNELCAVSTKLINTEAPAFEFWTSKDGENSDLLAKGIKLDGGNPGPGKILISVDNDGRAVWATPKLAANGRDIIFDPYDDSPVGVCGTPSPTPYWDVKWDGCKTIYDGTATTNIDPGDSVEYGTATCKNSNNQIVTGCTGTPWTDMDGSTPMRAAASSLAQCPTNPNGSSSDPVKSWYCHIGGGSWVDEGVSNNCHSAFSPAGYAFQDSQRVCSTVKPLDSSCVGPANNSGLPKWSDVKNQQFVCDKVNNVGYWTGASCR
jgi:hypothetical protein